MHRQSIISPERNLLSKVRRFGLLSVFLALCISAGCSSGGNDAAAPPPPPPPPPAGIGPAGGTVNGPGGSSIVVPANALAANTVIAIAQSSNGAPALPAELEPAGDMFAITPHGTAFAVAATVTIPFDPADVPAGRTVQLMKTNAAQNGWEAVAGATASGNTLAAQTSSLSWWLAALVAIGPTITTEPASQVVDVGQDASFSVVAEQNGGPFLMYQWQRDGNDISLATGPTYTLENVTAADNGSVFTVGITNGIGSISSQPATLTVNLPAAGWLNLGGPVVAAASAVAGGIAVHPDGRVAVTYIEGGLGTTTAQLYVSEWNGTSWTRLGNALNRSADDRVSVGARSIVYDSNDINGQPMVAWLDRATLDLVVTRWTGTAWVSLPANPLFPVAAATTDPQLQLDPQSGLPLVAISSGNFTSVREWTGSAWVPNNHVSSATLVGGFKRLTVLNSGQRLLAKVVVLFDTNNQLSGGQLRLFGPNNNQSYDIEFSPDILVQANGVIVLPGTNDPQIDYKRDALIVTDGIALYALTGDFAAGPLVVRRLDGSGWQTLTGDSGVRTTSVEYFITPTGLPWISYMTDASLASPLRRIDSVWWDGATWQAVPSASDSGVDVLFRFAATLSPDGVPYVLILQSNPNSTFANEIVVRRLDALTLTVIVNGSPGGGVVSIGDLVCAAGETCEIPSPTGATQQLIAAAIANVVSWEGCDSVDITVCTVVINQNRTVIATLL
jgi:hypothetical protein